MNEKMNVIFRKAYDKSTKKWEYLAVFPDIEANVGCLQALPFAVEGDITTFQPHCEISNGYYYFTKTIKDKELLAVLKECVEKYYNSFSNEGKVELVIRFKR